MAFTLADSNGRSLWQQYLINNGYIDSDGKRSISQQYLANKRGSPTYNIPSYAQKVPIWESSPQYDIPSYSKVSESNKYSNLYPISGDRAVNLQLDNMINSTINSLTPEEVLASSYTGSVAPISSQVYNTLNPKPVNRSIRSTRQATPVISYKDPELETRLSQIEAEKRANRARLAQQQAITPEARFINNTIENTSAPTIFEDYQRLRNGWR